MLHKFTSIGWALLLDSDSGVTAGAVEMSSLSHLGDQGQEKTHTRNRHLRNHRGCSVACSDGLSVACFKEMSLVSGIFKGLPLDFHWMLSGIFQWTFAFVISGV